MKRLNQRKIAFIFLFFIGIVGTGCEKYLDQKSDQKLVVPTNGSDFQALLDNLTYMIGSPSSGEISSDDYYLTGSDYGLMAYDNYRRMHVWEKDNLFAPNEPENDWQYTYTTIYYANTVLNGLAADNLPSAAHNNVEGQAYYYRGNAMLEAAQVWTMAYQQATAHQEMGLPIKLNTNFNEQSKRSTLAETYAQIIADLKKAVQLLPIVPVSKYRASKPAAYGVLARTYLVMGDYDKAYLYADSCLQLYDRLIDYNSLNTADAYPIQVNNVEVIHYKSLRSRDPIAVNYAKINPEVYASYETNDLRKQAFFRLNTDNSFRFKGSYRGGSAQFSGIATNEILLIRAESAIRTDRITVGLADLNRLMANRYRKINGVSTYIPVALTSPTALLANVLAERRKELLMRGLRWMDIKRLNVAGAGISLSRTINGTVYTLPANDLRFALPIPELVISLSGMEQNRR